MTDFITSIFSTYRSKVRNPFFGTLITVCIVRNWRIVYAVLNFDSQFSMIDKINYLNDYFSNKIFWCESLTNILYSFLILFLSYILLALARLLTDSYYKILEPWIITLIDKKTIFTKKDKDLLQNVIDGLSKSLEAKRDELQKAEALNDIVGSKRKILQEELDSAHKKAAIDQNEFDNNFKNLSNKYYNINGLVDFLDDLIEGMNKKTRDDLYQYVKTSDTIKSEYNSSSEVTQFLFNAGIVKLQGTLMKTTLLGELFLNYFKLIYPSKYN
jgi:hypothetical protein